MTSGRFSRGTRERCIPVSNCRPEFLLKPMIVRRIPRAEKDAIRTLGELGVATVHEAQGRTGLMRPYMRPIYPSAKIGGSALTISCHPGDNLMLHAAIDVCQPGDVLV